MSTRIAFLARPFGALLFGHFGDRVGRKTTLVASLLVMGISTMLIGVLPSYEMVGWVAPALLCLLRFGQGIGLGGEWGGAALLAAEYAPKGKRGWFGMFPQLGSPVGFLFAVGSAALLSGFLMETMLGSGSPFLITAFLSLELLLMGATFAPMGALLPELFPTSVRYTGAGAAYNLGGILGASLAAYLAQQLVQHGGLSWVGGHISVAAAISVLAALAIHETRDKELA